MKMAFGPTELILIAVVVILLFGARKLPQLGKSVGRTMGEYRKGKAESELELRSMEESYMRRQKNQDESGFWDSPPILKRRRLRPWIGTTSIRFCSRLTLLAITKIILGRP